MAALVKHTGRPRVDPDDDSVQVCVTLPASRYDQVYRDAQRAEISIPEAIRRQLAAARRDDHHDR